MSKEKLAHRIFCKSKLCDRFSADEMFLNDTLQNRRGAGMIPDTFGIYDGDGAARADAQATGLAAVNERLRANELEFLEPLFQKIPGSERRLPRRTFGFGGIHAEKDVAPVFFQAERFNGALQFVVHNVSTPMCQSDDAADGNDGPPLLDELRWGAHATEEGRVGPPEPLFPRLESEPAAE